MLPGSIITENNSCRIGSGNHLCQLAHLTYAVVSGYLSRLYRGKVALFPTSDNDASGPGDSESVRQVVAGDINAFEHLLKKYQNHVLRILKKRLPYERVEEAAQDVFIRAYQSLPTFRGESSFRHWLSTIAVRTCYDFWRKHYKSRELPMSSLTEKHQVWLEKTISEQSSQSFHELGSQEEAREILDWALGKLSAEDRVVVELVYLEGFTMKEAADLLGWTVANVKVRSFRSRKKLHKLLAQAIAP